jgi:hypothetical protein
MSFNAVNQYSANHKPWDHVGNYIPQLEYCPGERPHGEFQTAPWLPVVFYEKAYENWMTVLPGKLVAFDNNGHVVPAQYGLAGATITYDANDVSAGVIDVRTGVTLLTANIGTFNAGTVSGFMGTSQVLAVSRTVGVATMPFLQWAGDGSSLDDGNNPAGYRQHNYNLQHRVSILCDYVLELPLVPAPTTTANMSRNTYANNHQVFNALSNLPVATNTDRTPITFADGTLTDSETFFLNQKETVSGVRAAGDWHIDLDTGVITAYASAQVAAGNVYTVSYYHYNAAPSTVSDFACAVGNLRAGDFVECDTNSNFAEISGTEDFKDIIGQVLEVENVKGKALLDRVRTAWLPAIGTTATGSLPGYTGQMDQMPGTATGGVPAKVHYAGAADKVVRINLISR